MLQSSLYEALDPVYYKNSLKTGSPKGNGPNNFDRVLVIVLLLLSFIISFNLHFMS